MPSGLFLSCSNILSCTIPFPAGRQAAFSLFSEHTTTTRNDSRLLSPFWVPFGHIQCSRRQSSYVVFFKTSLFLIISLYVSAYDLFFSFFFFREEQQQVFLRFNVTPSANFLVCSKCVTGDSQQDRNARAYFLVKQENKQKKQRQSNKQNITKHKYQTEKKTKKQQTKLCQKQTKRFTCRSNRNSSQQKVCF